MNTMAERLRKARERAGFSSAAKAAEALGVSGSTYRAHENGQNSYGPDEAAVYGRKFGVSAAELLTGDVSSSETWNQNGSITVAPDKPVGTSGRFQQVRVIGSVKASSWQDVTEQISTDEPQYVPSASGFPAEWQYAYTVDGPSVNKTARDGDILVCVDLIKSGVDVTENDLVIVERTRFNGAMLERTAKRVRKAIAGPELWPDSDDPEHQDPIPLSAAEDDEIRVSAKVIWVLRKP